MPVDPDPHAAPEIVSIEPPNVRSGDTLLIAGKNFGDDAVALLNEVPLEVIARSPGELTVVAPEITDCAVEGELTVRSVAGTSQEKALRVEQPEARVEAYSGPFPAGEVVTIHGEHLAEAKVFLKERELDGVQSSADMIEFVLPRDVPPGAISVQLALPCSTIALSLQVTYRVPGIVSTDLVAVAPQGVVLLDIDTAPDETTQLSVEIDGESLEVETPAARWWPSSPGAASHRLAVRLPVEATVGSRVPISVTGATGTSQPIFVDVIDDVGKVPPVPAPIATVPLTAASAAYPTGTHASYNLADFTDANASHSNVFPGWSYAFNAQTTCDGKSPISGFERYCPGPDIPGQPCYSYPGGCLEGGPCHPMTGSFTLTTKLNEAQITIDRRSSGGVVEEYAGGWSTRTGEPVSAVGMGYFVLRSKRTGKQLAIQYPMNTVCNGM